MSKHLERALLLIEHRPQMAAKELLEAIAEEPDDPYLHALLSVVLLDCDDKEGAFKEAKAAIQLDPEYGFAFYALSKYHYSQYNMLDAEVAIDEALRLEPSNAMYWGMLSNIQIEQDELEEALKSAESGLEMEPEDVHCHNLRALLKTKLSKKKHAQRNTEDAQQSMETAMSADPENALTHAYRGWTLLEHHDHKESIGHFREALRLDPTMEWARQGLIKALQVRHWAYQIPLKIGKRGSFLLSFMFAALFFYLAAWSPPLDPKLLMVLKNGSLTLFIIFLIVPIAHHTILADPLMRFFLLFDHDGRLTLTPAERRFSMHLMAFLAIGLLSIAYSIATSTVAWLTALIVAVYFLTVPLTMESEKRDKKLWWSMVGCAVLFGGIVCMMAMPHIGIGAVRAFLVLKFLKFALTAAGAKALLGAIGLGATAAAMKEKEKQKIREKMLNEQDNSKSRR